MIDRAVYSTLSLYPWPGTVRELETVIERALVLDRDGVIGADDLPDRLVSRQPRVRKLGFELPDEGLSLEEAENELIVAALRKHNWNQSRAAAYLSITRSTLMYRMDKFGLPRGSRVPVPCSNDES